MKVKNIKNPQEFFHVIQTCQGAIELTTVNGDRINLKSKLSQYLALADTFKNPEIGEIEIICSEPEDYNQILKYLILGG